MYTVDFLRELSHIQRRGRTTLVLFSNAEADELLDPPILSLMSLPI